MPLLRPLSIFLRNALVKQHPWFSCCASCGEIKMPSENRLCSSLTPDFPVDAVLLGETTGTETVRQRLPWLRHIFAAGEAGSPAVGGTGTLSAAERGGTTLPAVPPAALLHLLPDLEEHYLIVRKADFVPASALIQDYFTPTGIPLIYCRTDTAASGSLAASFTGYHCHAQTRQNSLDFLSDLLLQEPDTDDKAYTAALFQWAYARARAVLVPHRLSAPERPDDRGRGEYARA